ncbi:MAG: hypothetical protein ABIZ81_13610 [Opitutaceae bacterium]
MKFNVALRLAGICGAMTAIASAQSERSAPGSAPAKESTVASVRPPLSFADAQKILAGDRKYVAHPTGSGVDGKVTEPEALPAIYPMDAPPPAPRAEIQPAAPGPDLVWVEGHSMPVEQEWRWVMGSWAKPATPISVWIPSRYNAKEKKWFPGYWEPDRPPMTPADSPASTKPAAVGK